MHGLNGPANQSMDLVVILPISRYGYVYARRVEVAASRTGVSVDRLLAGNFRLYAKDFWIVRDGP